MVYHGFPFSVLKVSIVEAVAANAAHQRLSSSCFSLWRALVGSAGGAHLMGGIARLSPEGAGLAVWSASPLLAQGFRCSSACALACGVVRTGYASLVTTGVAREERESVCVCVCVCFGFQPKRLEHESSKKRRGKIWGNLRRLSSTVFLFDRWCAG